MKKRSNRSIKSQYVQSSTRWRRVGTEGMEGLILITRVNRKPPAWKLETSDKDGNPIVAVLEKMPRGNVQLPGFRPFPKRNWKVILPDQTEALFKTRRQAIEYVDSLEWKAEEKEDE